MIVNLIDALHRDGQVRIVACHHEQAAGFAAEGHARMNGVPGVAMGTSGPGAINLLTALGSCHFDSTPAVFITGQVNRHERKLDRPIRQLGFQETDVAAMAAPIAKAAWRVETIEELPTPLRRSLRPGPLRPARPGARRHPARPAAGRGRGAAARRAGAARAAARSAHRRRRGAGRRRPRRGRAAADPGGRRPARRARGRRLPRAGRPARRPGRQLADGRRRAALRAPAAGRHDRHLRQPLGQHRALAAATRCWCSAAGSTSARPAPTPTPSSPAARSTTSTSTRARSTTGSPGSRRWSRTWRPALADLAAAAAGGRAGRPRRLGGGDRRPARAVARHRRAARGSRGSTPTS